MASLFDEGSCDEEEEYQPISKREEEQEQAIDPEYEYDTPTTLPTSPKVRDRNSSSSGFFNQSNSSGENNIQRIPTSRVVPRTNIMVRNDIKLPIFNENGLEDPEKHWFLCEVVWTV